MVHVLPVDLDPSVVAVELLRPPGLVQRRHTPC